MVTTTDSHPALRVIFAVLLGISLVGAGGCGESAEAEDARIDAAADEAAEAAYAATEEAEASDVGASEVEEGGYSGCIQDCSGHEAGFEWARDQDLSEESECGGNSASFIEGCQQFVQQRQELAEHQASEPAEEEAYDNTE